jgi:CBS domain-containing protein
MTADHRQLLVDDLMTKDIIDCPSDASLAAVAATLARRGVHAVFVLDGEGQPLGVLSDFDLLAGEWLGQDPEGLRTMREMTAGDLVSSPVETIGRYAPAPEAAERMRELRLGRLLVLDEHGSPAGVISVSDLVAPLGRTSGEGRSVRDVMSHAIVTCPPDTSLEAAARAMTERRSRSIIVVSDAGRAVGVITGSDLLCLYEPGRLRETQVSELMRAPVIMVGPEEAIGRAAELMVEHEVHRVVVVDDPEAGGVPLGLVSTSDIVAEMAAAGSVWQATA